ncbi:MAG TPA: Mur ligase family protein [Chloroflexia bacterium]|jgi:UDP-N-acetylmuramyl tripeptide synthase
MRNPVLVAAVNAGKASALATRLLGRGGGTALPGLVAQVVYPGVLRALTAQLPEGSFMVTGTNGKTTTSRMLASILEAAGLEPLHNRSGSNLERGLVSTVVGAATPLGGLPRDLRVGLFEVDEAAMPGALAAIRPKVALFNNLFRDQLDRYGEIDTIHSKWRAALPKLGAGSTIVLNADDPAIASLSMLPGLRGKVCTFGIDDPRHALDALPHAADSISCPRCNSRLDYSLILLGHLGHWRCPECGLARPQPDVVATQVTLNGTESSDVTLRTPAGEMRVTLKVPGLYNVYNGLAAVSAALSSGITPEHIKAGLERFTAAFGRIERVPIPGSDGKSLLMALVKNPVGFNEVLRMLLPLEARAGTGATPSRHLLIIINDLIADGRDVSWLWDVDFEILAGSPELVGSVYVSGIRASDMAVRLKYAGIDPSRIEVEGEMGEALDAAVRALPPGQTLYVLPTYTAMLAFRKLLHGRGWVQSQFWEQ